MTEHQTRMILLLAGTAALPIVIEQFTDSQETIDLAYGLSNVGLVGTMIGVGLGLVTVPRLPVWASALILTLAGFGIKMYMLPHGEHDEHPIEHETHAPALAPDAATS